MQVECKFYDCLDAGNPACMQHETELRGTVTAQFAERFSLPPINIEPFIQYNKQNCIACLIDRSVFFSPCPPEHIQQLVLRSYLQEHTCSGSYSILSDTITFVQCTHTHTVQCITGLYSETSSTEEKFLNTELLKRLLTNTVGFNFLCLMMISRCFAYPFSFV